MSLTVSCSLVLLLILMPYWTYTLRDWHFSVQIYEWGTSVSSSSPNKLVSTYILSAYYFSRTVLGSWTTFSLCITSDLCISPADWGSVSGFHSWVAVGTIPQVAFRKIPTVSSCLSCVSLLSPEISLLFLKHGGTYSAFIYVQPTSCGELTSPVAKLWPIRERGQSLISFFLSLHGLSGEPVASSCLSEDILQIRAFSYKEVRACLVTYFLLFAFPSFLPHSCFPGIALLNTSLSHELLPWDVFSGEFGVILFWEREIFGRVKGKSQW